MRGAGRDVVEHGVAEHESKPGVLEGQAFGVGRRGLDLEPHRWALAESTDSMPGEMSLQVASAITPARQRFR